ncbi:MAG TPA: ArsC/Spx/MgsR family protein [Acidimicrobiales bacterium]|nr:ArsC/Spx/MgsR family protein [Acidimicrobiales bacterium]
MAVAKEVGIDADIVQYLKTPPDKATLEKIIGMLEDPVEDLVRKDAKFEKLGLDPAAYVGKPKAVVDILLQHKELMQRPIIVKGNKAIIGRPKDKAEKFLKAK